MRPRTRALRSRIGQMLRGYPCGLRRAWVRERLAAAGYTPAEIRRALAGRGHVLKPKEAR